MKMTLEELRKWIRNKNVRIWKRSLYLLYEDGPLSLSDISTDLDSDPSGNERQLKKMAINHWVKREKHKWYITETGVNKVEAYQKFGTMPSRKWGD